MHLRALVGAAAIVVAACRGGGPTNPGGDLDGSYSGTHTFTFNIIGGDPFGITCQGSIVIFDVVGGSFDGTLRINACPPVSSTVFVMLIEGAIGTNQAISFTSSDLDEFIEDIEEDLGCPATRVDPSFTGTLANARILASLTATLACEDRATREFEWVVEMQKVS